MINLLPGDGIAVSEVALAHPDLAGIHFTGSTATFQHLWQTVGANIAGYRSLPAAGGRDRRQGLRGRAPQRRPGRAADRAGPRRRSSTPARSARPPPGPTSPRSVWDRVEDDLVDETEALPVGDVRDLANFTSAVIDQRAFAKHRDAIERARMPATAPRSSPAGRPTTSDGWFVRPTLIVSDNPRNEIFTTEYFGPILGIYVYDDADFADILDEVDQAAPYGLTGAVIADDRAALAQASRARCGTRPATSTSTTSRPARWSASSRSAAPGPPAPTTRPARCGT